MFDELEIVELTHDIKGKNLREGERGTVVEIYDDGKAYEVEFIAPDGKTTVLLTLSPEDIRHVVRGVIYPFLSIPVYFSTVTVSGTTPDFITDDLPKKFNALNLETRIEMVKNKTDTKEFDYPVVTI